MELDITEPLDILDSDSFTLIIDKGTLDCVVCSSAYQRRTQQMLQNVHRILAPGGCFVCVSYGRPETRLGYFKEQAYKWQVEVQKIQKKNSVEVFERID